MSDFTKSSHFVDNIWACDTKNRIFSLAQIIFIYLISTPTKGEVWFKLPSYRNGHLNMTLSSNFLDMSTFVIDAWPCK